LKAIGSWAIQAERSENLVVIAGCLHVNGVHL